MRSIYSDIPHAPLSAVEIAELEAKFDREFEPRVAEYLLHRRWEGDREYGQELFSAGSASNATRAVSVDRSLHSAATREPSLESGQTCPAGPTRFERVTVEEIVSAEPEGNPWLGAAIFAAVIALEAWACAYWHIPAMIASWFR